MLKKGSKRGKMEQNPDNSNRKKNSNLKLNYVDNYIKYKWIKYSNKKTHS